MRVQRQHVADFHVEVDIIGTRKIWGPSNTIHCPPGSNLLFHALGKAEQSKDSKITAPAVKTNEIDCSEVISQVTLFLK